MIGKHIVIFPPTETHKHYLFLSAEHNMPTMQGELRGCSLFDDYHEALDYCLQFNLQNGIIELASLYGGKANSN